MATVRDLHPLFDGLIGQHGLGVSPETKTALLNLAKTEVWRILVRNATENWFVVESQSSTPGQSNYFPPLTVDTREYALPSSLKKLRAIEATGAPADKWYFEHRRFDSDEFRGQRISGEQWRNPVIYDLYGPASNSLLAFASLPPEAMTLRLLFVKRPEVWATQSVNIDEFPEDCHDLIAEWAAFRHLLGKEKGNRWHDFRQEWKRRVELWMDTDHADNTGPDVVQGLTF